MKKLLFCFVFVDIIIACNSKKDNEIPIKPIANFTFEKGKNGEVIFKNSSQNSTTFKWDFGNGLTSSETNPTHFFKTNKSFTVILIAANKNSETQFSQTINIDSYPELGFSGTLNNKNFKITSNQTNFKFKQSQIGKFGYNFNYSNDSLNLDFDYFHSDIMTYNDFIKVATNSGFKPVSSFLIPFEGFRLGISDMKKKEGLLIFDSSDENNKIEVSDVYKEQNNCKCDSFQYWITFNLTNIDKSKPNGKLIVQIINPCCN